MSKIIFFLFLAITATITAGENGTGVFWSEDFSRMEVGPAGGFGKDCVIKEENGLKYLHGTGWMLGKMRYFGAGKWNDYTFKFKFRFTDPKKISFFPYVKARGKRDRLKFLWYYLNFRKDALNAICHGIKGKDIPKKHKTKGVKYADSGFALLKAGVWYAMRIEVTFDKIRVFLSNDDKKFVKLADFNVIPGSGGCGILSGSPVDLADMSVMALEKTEKTKD